jgi:hypothetical protein
MWKKKFQNFFDKKKKDEEIPFSLTNDFWRFTLVKVGRVVLAGGLQFKP